MNSVRCSKLVLAVAASAFILMVSFPGCSRRNEKVLARVGDVEISADDYAARLSDFLLSTSMKDNIKVRRQILENMIHEELILAEARKRGWLEDTRYQQKYNRVRTQAILDDYRLRYIAARVTVDEEDLKRAAARLNVRVGARHLYARTEQEAWELRDLLLQGSTFEELAMKVFQDPKLKANGGYLGYFTYGEMDPAFEEAAYRLRIGEISEPVKTAWGYSIIKVEARVSKPMATEYEFLQRKKQLARVIRASKIDEKVKQATEEIAQQISPKFNERVVDTLLHAWPDLEPQKEVNEVLNKSGFVDQRARSAVVAEFTNGKWTVEDVLNQFPLTTERQRKYVKTSDDLKQFVIGLLVREQLLRQALHEKIDKLPEVGKRIQTEIRVFTLERWRSLITDTVKVPEDLLCSWYQKHASSYLFPEGWDISEMAVSSRKKALDLLHQLRSGVSFELLARKHSMRPSTVTTGGHLGLLTRERLGKWINEVAGAKKGETVGPFDIGGYYSLVKVNGYQPSKQKTLEEAKLQITGELLWQLKQEAFFASLEQLRKDTSIWVNDSLLIVIQLNNSMTRSAL
jgi:parvulin-like peptidyl-prolyl isomerase